MTDVDLRVGDADRERAALSLRDAAADGRLTLDELPERLDAAYRARTRNELDAVLLDLGRPESATRTLTARSRRHVVSVMGGTSLRGRYRLDGGLRVVALMGGANVDLRQAELAEPETTITVVALMGGVDIVVPDGIEVDAHGVIPIMGGRNVRASQSVPVDAPRVRIRGVALMGGVNVRTTRRKKD